MLSNTSRTPIPQALIIANNLISVQTGFGQNGHFYFFSASPIFSLDFFHVLSIIPVTSVGWYIFGFLIRGVDTKPDGSLSIIELGDMYSRSAPLFGRSESQPLISRYPRTLRASTMPLSGVFFVSHGFVTHACCVLPFMMDRVTPSLFAQYRLE